MIEIVSEKVSTTGAARYCEKMDVLIAFLLPPASSTISSRLLAVGVAVTATAAR